VAEETQAEPITAGERIPTLDAIRGIALLGILIMNMAYFHQAVFGEPAVQKLPWWDQVVSFIQSMLLEGRFNAMFSLLFGIGFTIQLTRLRARDPEHAAAIYLRRTLWLLVFGLVHACLFWNGDVLHIYALLGLLLIAGVGKLSDPALLIVIVLCMFFPPVFNVVAALTTTPEEVARMHSAMQALGAAQEEAYSHGTFWQAAHQHTLTEIAIYTTPWIRGRFIIGTLGLATTMFIGMLLARHRVFENLPAWMPKIKKVTWWSLAAGLAGGAVFAIWSSLTPNRAVPTIWKAVASGFFVVCRVGIMAFYVTLIIRGMQSSKWRTYLKPIALAGRMPLTNYLMQTLICTSIFMGWGLGVWNRPGPSADLAISLLIFFGIQIPFSIVWLRRFDMGPLEYVWRTLTYGYRPAAKAAFVSHGRGARQ
jgi:uncharacterized protein